MDVLIISGSSSDSGLVEKVEKTLEEFGVSYESRVASAHRDPGRVEELVKGTDAKVIIAVAGLSAALPGVCASHTTKPVIGLPRDVKLGGMDSLLSMAQMPPGVPVATVGIDNARNAAVLAVEVLALADEALGEKLQEYREALKG
ncbi:MAG: 5-(carboxyamino)imidazole ribonucleotide mutase [Euryarchaeota archaeon]|nr:5-(carboxyamino)imidazole ribonucleotide mutase [Euryarchaeota archaeon]